VSEQAFDARAHLVKGIVLSVDDSGDVQTVTVKTHDGFIRSDIPIAMPFGFASMPSLDGATVLLMAVGGDPANYEALPIGNPSRRFGNQAAGETAMYGHDGSRVQIKAGGAVEVWGAKSVTIHTPTVAIVATGTVTVTAAHIVLNGPVDIGGPLNVAGAINATGTIHGA
jgi:phage baseplate assembly protein V